MSPSLERIRPLLSGAAESMFPGGDARISADWGPGWDRVVAHALNRIASFRTGCVVDQIKEKFGGLRLYVSGTQA